MQNDLERGIAEAKRKNYDVAERYLLQAARDYHQSGRMTEKMKALSNLATILTAKGQLKKALRISEEVLGNLESMNDSTATIILIDCATRYWHKGEINTVEKLILEAESRAKRESDKFLIQRAILGRSFVSYCRGEFNRAERFVEEALRIAQKFGSPRAFLWIAIQQKARISLEKGELGKCKRLSEVAYGLVRGRGLEGFATESILTLGKVAYLEGKGTSLLKKAASMAAESGDFGRKMEVALSLAYTVKDREGVLNVLEWAEKEGYTLLKAKAVHHLGYLTLENGKLRKAANLVEEMSSTCESIGCYVWGNRLGRLRARIQSKEFPGLAFDELFRIKEFFAKKGMLLDLMWTYSAMEDIEGRGRWNVKALQLSDDCGIKEEILNSPFEYV